MAINKSLMYIKLSKTTEYEIVFPIQCQFERFKFFPKLPKNTNKQAVDFFRIQINTVEELNGGLSFNLEKKQEYGLRYRLRVNIIDKNENCLISIKPMMLLHNGMVNDNLPAHQRTLYVTPKHEIHDDQENSDDDNDNLH